MSTDSKRSANWRLSAFVAVVALSVALAPAPRASADRIAGGDLMSVSCPTATFCVSVGVVQGALNALIETWDNHHWTARVRHSPSFLTGVSCRSTTHCVAVGAFANEADDTYTPIAETFDGTTWSVQTVPLSAGWSTTLEAVSCPSSTHCVAVGTDFKNDLKREPRAVVETLNGSTWSKTILAAGGRFASISCISATNCAAVGTFYATSTRLLETWNGSNWSQIPPADPTAQTELDGVSCPTSTTCIAVGRYNGGPYAIKRNGSTWGRLSIPGPSGFSAELEAVACSSVNVCMAVGAANESTEHVVSEAWNGSTWTRHDVPNPAGTTEGILNGVSCADDTDCFAVGSAEFDQSTIAERWDGTSWSALSPL